MTDRPLLFSAPMVRSLLDDTKTQTRRLLKPQPITRPIGWGTFDDNPRMRTIRCPHGAPGDRIWVKETWGLSRLWDDSPKEEVHALASHRSHVRYAAGPGPRPSGKLRPSIFMPRAASRITLDLLGVRVERLNEISEEDAKAEGVACPAIPLYPEDCGCFAQPDEIANRWHYRLLWESIHGPGSWDLNPWVWVLTFRRTV